MTKHSHNPQIERFASLFRGRADVWGALHGEAVKEQVTATHYSQHLAGRVSLGVYPLKLDGQVRWCAIDIDKNDIAVGVAVVDSLVAIGMTEGVYLERSKGKGFHVLVLFSDRVSAIDARRVMRYALHETGLPMTTEIFPKQDQLTKNTQRGNYLNLPYFGGRQPRR